MKLDTQYLLCHHSFSGNLSCFKWSVKYLENSNLQNAILSVTSKLFMKTLKRSVPKKEMCRTPQ